MSFEEVKEKYGLRNSVFPYAKAGVKLLNTIRLCFMFLAIITVFTIGIAAYFQYRNSYHANTVSSDIGILDHIIIYLGGDVSNVSNSTVHSQGSSVLHETFLTLSLKDFALEVLKYLWLLWLVLLMFYIINIIKRQRLYERHVYQNDKEAIALKKNILNKRGIQKKIDVIKKTIKARAQKDKTGSTLEEPNEQEQYQLEALEAELNMMVIVNSRENSSHIVEKFYNIYFTVPETQGGKSALENSLDNRFNDTASSAMGYNIFFGERRVSNDGSFYFQANGKSYLDPYYYEQQINELQMRKNSFDYEHTMPYSKTEKKGKVYIGLKDHNAENERRKIEAKRWASSKVEEIEELLRGNGIKVTFEKVSPQAKTAEFYFKIPEEVSVKGIDRAQSTIADKVDEMFDCVGTTLKINMNSALLSLPLPNGKTTPDGQKTPDFRQMINNEEVLRRAFG